MPEALAVLFVLVVILGVIVFCGWNALRSEAAQDVAAQIRHWEHQQAWVRERLEKARLENWDADMVLRLEEQSRLAEVRLQRLAVRPAVPPASSGE